MLFRLIFCSLAYDMNKKSGFYYFRFNFLISIGNLSVQNLYICILALMSLSRLFSMSGRIRGFINKRQTLKLYKGRKKYENHPYEGTSWLHCFLSLIV